MTSKTVKTADLPSDDHKPPSESQLDELRHAMRAAIEARDISEIERVFVWAHQILTNAQVYELRYKRGKNIESQRRYWEIALGIERLRGQWLIDTEKAALRLIRPKDTKFGVPTGLVVLDAPGRPPRIFIDRKKSQDLQAFAGLSEEQFKAVLADKTKMLTVAGVLRLYATPKPGHSIGVLGMKSTKRLLPLSAIRVDEQAQPRPRLLAQGARQRLRAVNGQLGMGKARLDRLACRGSRPYQDEKSEWVHHAVRHAGQSLR